MLPTDQPLGDPMWPHFILATGLAATTTPGHRGQIPAQPQGRVWAAFQMLPAWVPRSVQDWPRPCKQPVGIYGSMCQKGCHGK